MLRGGPGRAALLLTLVSCCVCMPVRAGYAGPICNLQRVSASRKSCCGEPDVAALRGSAGTWLAMALLP